MIDHLNAVHDKIFIKFIFFVHVIEEQKGGNLEHFGRKNARQLAFEEFLQQGICRVSQDEKHLFKLV